VLASLSPEFDVGRASGIGRIQVFVGSTFKSIGDFLAVLPGFETFKPPHPVGVAGPVTNLPPPFEQLHWMLDETTDAQVLGREILDCVNRRAWTFYEAFGSLEGLIRQVEMGSHPFTKLISGYSVAAAHWLLGDRMRAIAAVESIRMRADTEYQKTRRPADRWAVGEAESILAFLRDRGG
jgi:hypothetical protein